jgi:hypothetical protein
LHWSVSRVQKDPESLVDCYFISYALSQFTRMAMKQKYDEFEYVRWKLLGTTSFATGFKATETREV